MTNLDISDKMDKVCFVMDKDFSALRTGRASPGLIDKVMVKLPNDLTMTLSQISSITVMGNQLLSVRVWDKSSIKKVEKALVDANLGVSLTIEGDMIFVKLPILSEERRKELVKTATKYSEKAKITLRSIRREHNDKIKIQERKKEISKDESFNQQKQIQKLLDQFIEKVDKKLSQKTKEIMTI